ncbi:hypothetical protein LSH36_1183g00008 [Paralvinella palmiformis]|uniref:EF-hand domain-containing protein n=1 Tax=Paralvinella palmiformis TaxID=53620 RepID=A0AAD9IVH8_9ANNE|nr:hypothetical protein LSH36_1183g00008 [Paralvinella palmiformis]
MTSLSDVMTFAELKFALEKWRYGKFDKDCPSGQLSRKKFMAIYVSLFPDGKAGPFYEHVFRTFDQDGSGKIDFKEFLQAIGVTQDGNPEDKLELAFRLYDIDRNGSIEEDEMAEIIRAIYYMTETDVDKVGDAPRIRTRDIFIKMDANRDGVLSKEEFIEGCLNDETLYRLLACSSDEQES